MYMNKWLLPVSLSFGLASVLFISFGDQGYAISITDEDGPIEDLTALFYFLGFLLALISVFRSEIRYFPALWAILCFVFLGEETSWFQRIFDYTVPAVEEMNAQGEFNLHNLKIFQGEELFVDGKINKVGLFDYLFSTQNIFRLGFFGYFLIFPIVANQKRIKLWLSNLGYVKPSSKFTFTMLVVMASSFALAVVSPPDVKSAMAETREMFYAYFILVYLVMCFWPDERPRAY